MGKKITHEDYLKKFNKVMSLEYELKSAFINSKTKVSILHKICNKLYETLPHVPIKGHGCPFCANKKASQKQRKNQECFEQQVFEITNGEYKVMSEYKTAKQKIKLLHIKCNNFLETTADSFMSKGTRCKHCKINKKKKTHDHFVKEVNDLTGDEYSVLGIYQKASSKLKIIHNKCGHSYEVTPNNFLSGYRCPICMNEESAKKLRWSIEKYVEEVKGLHGDEYIVLSDYVNAREKIKMKHSTCGFDFITTPYSFLKQKSKCQKCSTKSNGEDFIGDWLIENNITYSPQFSFDNCRNPETKYLLPFDFAIFNKNNKLSYILEFDGQQHFRPVDFAGKGEDWASHQFNLTKQRDQLKNNYCKVNNIPLFRIPYWDYNEIENILVNALKYLNNKAHNEKITHKYLVNHPDWSHEEYIKQAK